MTSAHTNRADDTRQRILRAAVRQFSENGLAGARTDAIAQAAGVNKALLYYYFKNKEGLYAAAIEEVSTDIVESALAALKSGKTPGESLLRLLLNHFDRLLTKREFQSLMQHEMVRFRSGQTETIHLFAKKVFMPLLAAMQEQICRGIATGELSQVDWLQVVYAGFGANVFYFLSAPMMRLVLPFDPMDAAALRRRRTLALQFVGATLFQNRNHGSKLADRVLASTPMPKIQDFAAARRCS